MKQKQPGGGLGSSHPFESNESVTAHWSMFQSVFNLSRLKHITKVVNFFKRNGSGTFCIFIYHYFLIFGIDCSKEHIFDESCSLNIRIANADNSNDKQNENFCRRKTKGFFD